MVPSSNMSGNALLTMLLMLFPEIGGSWANRDKSCKPVMQKTETTYIRLFSLNVQLLSI